MTVLLFPGQGSQFKGMGADLFDAYPALTIQADEVLGYSIRELCVDDPHRRLTDTRYTQAAIYVVSALALQRHLDQGGAPVRGCAGHSLGEYSALSAAGVFDFATGLKLVKRRGELMSRIRGGAMSAVIGLERARLEAILDEAGVDIDIANHNSHTQLVLAGPEATIAQAETALRPHADRCRVVRLRVSGAFHSRMMREAADEFDSVLGAADYQEPRFEVIANCSVQPYLRADVRTNLSRQLCAPVRWLETIQYFLDRGATEFVELGPGQVLTKLLADIRGRHPGRPAELTSGTAQGTRDDSPIAGPAAAPGPAPTRTGVPEASKAFMDRWGCGNLCVAGSLGALRSTPRLLATLADAGVLCFSASEGLQLAQVAEQLEASRSAIKRSDARRLIGLNVHAGAHGWHSALLHLAFEMQVSAIELAGFSAPDEAIVLYRARGIGSVPGLSSHRILVKLRDIGYAAAFMRPAPPHIVQVLQARGDITSGQAEALLDQPLVDAVCLDRSSWREPATGSVPASIESMHDQYQQRHAHGSQAHAIGLGLAGSLGTPNDVAAAVQSGAHFVMIGSALQISDEADLSPSIREQVARLRPEDHRKTLDGHLIQFGHLSCTAIDNPDCSVPLQMLQHGLRRLVSGERQAADLMAELGARDWPMPLPSGADVRTLRDWLIACASQLGATSGHRILCSPAASAALRWWRRDRQGYPTAAHLMNRLQEEGLAALGVRCRV